MFHLGDPIYFIMLSKYFVTFSVVFNSIVAREIEFKFLDVYMNVRKSKVVDEREESKKGRARFKENWPEWELSYELLTATKIKYRLTNCDIMYMESVDKLKT